jgi:hypothetical protein
MLQALSAFAQTTLSDPNYTYTTSYTTSGSSELSGGVIAVLVLVFLVVAAAVIAGMWKMFVKAGKPGWAAIIPIYNYIVNLQIVGRPAWWALFLLLGFIPIVGGIASLVVAIIVTHDTSKSFGRGVGTTLLLIFLPFIGYPMLGFGSAEYKGPSALQNNGGAGGPTGPTGMGGGTPTTPTTPSVTPPTAPSF